MNGNNLFISDVGGIYCGTVNPYENVYCPYNLREVSLYLKNHKKNFYDLSQNELEDFKTVMNS